MYVSFSDYNSLSAREIRGNNKLVIVTVHIFNLQFCNMSD